MLNKNMPPPAALSVILFDLHLGGVTEGVSDTPFGWTASLQPPQESKPIALTPVAPLPEVKEPTPTPTFVAPQPVILPDEPTTWLTGSPRKLLILTGAATYSPKPFTGEEESLLCKMLSALGLLPKEATQLDLEIMGVFATTAESTDQTPVKKLLAEHQPEMVLGLSKLGAMLALGIAQELNLARQQFLAEGFTPSLGLPTGITFHPRTLLKQPQLKRHAWEDLQHWQKQWMTH